NIAGRVTSLVVHPNRPETLYAGSAGGGVWRSVDNGKHWRPSWPRYVSQNIGALAINPNNQQSLIAATGEANMSPDTYPGTGIYVSRDGGKKWQSFFVTPEGRPLPLSEREQMPRRVGAIAF